MQFFFFLPMGILQLPLFEYFAYRLITLLNELWIMNNDYKMIFIVFFFFVALTTNLNVYSKIKREKSLLISLFYLKAKWDVFL